MEKTTKLSLYDLLQQFKIEIGRDLRVCLPGSVEAVNAADGTVDVSVSVMQRLFQVGLPLGVPQAYPILPHCPVISIQGGGVGTVMPIKVGDECLVIFSDRCIDTWFTTGKTAALPSTRMHNIADGFVLVGLNSVSKKMVTSLLQDGSEGGLCETHASVAGVGAAVALNPTTHKISIRNGTQNLFNALTDLRTALTLLVTTLNTLTTTGGPTTQTISPATVTALIPVTTALTAVQTELTGLLY